MVNREIKILINGGERSVPADRNVVQLLEVLGLDPRTVVVELNRTIIRKQQLTETILKENDTVELVHFVGGG